MLISSWISWSIWASTQAVNLFCDWSQAARGQALPGRCLAASSSSNASRTVRGTRLLCCPRTGSLNNCRSFGKQDMQMWTDGITLLQVTSMIATGPRPPLSFNSANDESPVKLNIGGGMGAHFYLHRDLRLCFKYKVESFVYLPVNPLAFRASVKVATSPSDPTS